MTTPTRTQLLLQLDEIDHNGLLAMLKIAAGNDDVPLSFVLAIGSRETNLKNILGDYQSGEYHGVGILQIDIQHDIARQARDDGTWKGNPQPLIDYGVAMLAANIRSVRGYFDDVTEDEVYQIAADGYNEGMGRALKDAQDGGDPDRGTTGHDYGSDVVARMKIFDSLLAAIP